MSFFTPTILSEIIKQLVLHYFPLTSEVSMEFLSVYRGLFKLYEFMQNSLKCTDACVLVCVLVLVIVIMSSDANSAS